MDYLLRELKHQVLGLRDSGDVLSHHMKLLHVTWESYLDTQYPRLQLEQLPIDTISEQDQSVTNTSGTPAGGRESYPDTPAPNSLTPGQYRSVTFPLRWHGCLHGARRETIGLDRGARGVGEPWRRPAEGRVACDVLKLGQAVNTAQSLTGQQSENCTRVSDAQTVNNLAITEYQPHIRDVHNATEAGKTCSHIITSSAHESDTQHLSLSVNVVSETIITDISTHSMAYPGHTQSLRAYQQQHSDNNAEYSPQFTQSLGYDRTSPQTTCYTFRTHGRRYHPTTGSTPHSPREKPRPSPGMVHSQLRRSSAGPDRLAIPQGQFYDSYTDRLVRDVVRLTFFGGETSTPVQPGGLSPAMITPVAADTQGLRPGSIPSAPRTPVRRTLSPNTICSSGYDSEPEYTTTTEEEIDNLFDSRNNRTVVRRLSSTLPSHDTQYNRDEFVISPDDLYIDQHQRETDSTTTPIKRDLNSSGSTPRAQQCGYGGQKGHSSSKTSTPSSRAQTQSPSERKLNKVSKSMQDIISDLDVTAKSVTTSTTVKSKVIYETDLDSSGLSETNTPVKSGSPDPDTSGLSEADSSIHVPLTSTPVPSMQDIPTVTYTSYQELMNLGNPGNRMDRLTRGIHGNPYCSDVFHASPTLSAVVCDHPGVTAQHVTGCHPSISRSLTLEDNARGRGPSPVITGGGAAAAARGEGQREGRARASTLKHRHQQQAPQSLPAHRPENMYLTSDVHKVHNALTMHHKRAASKYNPQRHHNMQYSPQDSYALTDSMRSTSTSQFDVNSTSLMTTNMLQNPDADSTLMSDISMRDLLCSRASLRSRDSLRPYPHVSPCFPRGSPRDSVRSIRVRPRELMFDEDYYLQPRSHAEFNPRRSSSGSESSLQLQEEDDDEYEDDSLPDGTLLLNHLQDSEFWNSRGSTTSSSLAGSIFHGSISSPPHVQSSDSTVSSDSGRGSSSAMDIADLRCTSSDDSFLCVGATSTEPIYETIPDHLVREKNTDSDATLCEELSTRGMTVTENTYATIDGAEVKGQLKRSSYHSFPSTSFLPPEPPARNSQSRSTLPLRTSVSSSSSCYLGNSRRHQSARRGIRRDDVISHNPYHVYTVGDVLESFHRLASNIPTSPAATAATTLTERQMQEEEEADISDLYAQIRNPAHLPRPARRPPHPPTRGAYTITGSKKRRETSTTSIEGQGRNKSEGHRRQGHRSGGSSHINTDCIQGRRRRSLGAQHEGTAPAVRTVTAPVVTPIWRSGISHIQGTLC